MTLFRPTTKHNPTTIGPKTVLFLSTACLIIVGLAVYGNKVNENLPPYPTTLLVCAAAFGVLGGVFSLVDLCK